jgi:RNA polymerase sigma-70 factor (ECF subfamily)
MTFHNGYSGTDGYGGCDDERHQYQSRSRSMPGHVAGFAGQELLLLPGAGATITMGSQSKSIAMSINSNPEEVSGGLLPEVFSRYGRLLARAVGRLVRPHDVEDIVQETYLRVFQAAKTHPIRSPQAFMLKTARNIVLDKLAKADALNHVAELYGDEESGADDDSAEQFCNEQTPDTVLESEQEFTVFCRAIRELPRQCRRAFLLKKVYGLSQHEVAARLGVSEGTVEKHITKAMVQCALHMQSSGYRQRQSSWSETRRSRAVP